MKNFLKLILIVVVFATVYHFRFELGQKLKPYLENIGQTLHLTGAPCEEPIKYTLGAFAPEFKISQDYFLSAISEAEAIWEKASGRELFTHTPESSPRDLKINLVYDYRQQATDKLGDLGIIVENNKASYESLKIKFESLKREYERDKDDYERRVDAFNRSDRTDEAEFKSLQHKREELNAKVSEINAMVVVLNKLITSLNISVDKYNTTSVSRGETFEEGVYVSDGLKREIDIYEFSSRAKLVRVLAHELGHALELEHVSDPKAIMYELNQSDSIALSETDIALLKAKCLD